MTDASQKTSVSLTTPTDLDLTGDFGQGNNDITSPFDSDSKSKESVSYTRVSEKILQLLRGTSVRRVSDSRDAPDHVAACSENADPYPIDGPRYRIGKKIGQGGMGIVYAGWDIQLQRRIAIKLIRDEEMAKPKGLLRFFREARIAARMQHPSIVSVHEFDIDSDGRAFIVMGLLDGETLRTVLANETLRNEQNRISEMPGLLTVFLKICQAIAHAHSRGIIHRDLKPLNVMVGGYGVVTVLDWGIAKLLPHSEALTSLVGTDFESVSEAQYDSIDEAVDEESLMKTRLGEMLGTPSYVAPEQARGEVDRIDKRSDVFSLGAILCEILTGHPPYIALTLKEVYKQASSANLSSALSRLDRSAAPPVLVNLTKQCLSPFAKDRPADASDLVTAITAYLDSGQLRAEQELVRFFDLSMDLFCIAGTNGYFYRLNANFERVLGYTSVELTSCQFVEFVHADDRAKTLVEVEKLARGESAIQFVNRYRHKDGRYISLEWMARSVPEEAAIYAVARDVTERIAVSEAREKLEAEHHLLGKLVDSTEDAIICEDFDGFIRSWNAAAETVFGYSADEIVGKHMSILLKPEQLREELAIIDEVRRRGTIRHFQTVRVGKGGAEIRVSISMSLLPDSHENIISVSKIVQSNPDTTTAPGS